MRSRSARRAIAVQYPLVTAGSGSLIIPGSWVRAPPAPPAVYRLFTRHLLTVRGLSAPAERTVNLRPHPRSVGPCSHCKHQAATGRLPDRPIHRRNRILAAAPNSPCAPADGQAKDPTRGVVTPGPARSAERPGRLRMDRMSYHHRSPADWGTEQVWVSRP